jgi:hypothetical protein
MRLPVTASDGETMRVDAAFKKRIHLQCLEALQAAGFTRYRTLDVDWPIEHGFHCWVSPNTALYPDRVKVFPLVGLHVVPIEKLWKKLTDRKYDRGVATYAINMGQLEGVADERAFAFGPEQSAEFIASEIRRLASLYAGAGLGFARSMASYEALLPRLRERISSLGAFPERTASCLHLMGRSAEARVFVRDFLVKEEDYFRAFAVPFLQMLDEAA